MSKRHKKQIVHIRRGEGFARDHIGHHKNDINANGAGIVIDRDGKEHHF